jgi:Helix-turn-helix domain
MIPVTELATMKPVHTHVLAGVRSFANEAGICWPGLRRLAARCGMKLSSLQRAVADMVSLGYLTRERRGAGFLYRIAARFLRQRPTSGTGCPTSGTEGETKKEEVEDFKKEGGPVPLSRPDSRDVPQTVGMPIGDSRRVPENVGMPNGDRPQKPAARPADGPNPFARRQWLRRLNTYVSERLCGPQQWAGWEVIAKAEVGPIGGNDQRLLDGLDRMMRATKPAAASL